MKRGPPPIRRVPPNKRPPFSRRTSYKPHTRGAISSRQRRSFWQNLPPYVRSSLMVFIFIVLFQIINALTIGLGLLILYPLQVLIYAINGSLAARIYYEDIFQRLPYSRQSEAIKNGAASGVVLSVFTWIVLIILIFLLGLVSFGIGWAGYLSCVVCGPGDLGVAASSGALGAWLYERYWT